MTDPNDLNLTEFDLTVYDFATEELNLSEDEAFEASVNAAREDSSEYIPLDDINLLID